MQISSFSEEQQMALANEASKLTAEFKAAFTMDATVSDDEAVDFLTIRAYPTGGYVVLHKKHPKTDKHFICLPL